MADDIISRESARLQGLSSYFTGKPCKRGHINRRRVSDHQCIECSARSERLEQKRSWRKNNPHKVRQYTQNWRDRFPEKNRQQVAEWRAKNPDQVRAKNAEHKHIRRAREKAAAGKVTADELREILKSQQERCAYCRKKIRRKYHVDHITALANGGSNDRTNIQLTCPACNRAKRTKSPLAFARMLGRLL